MRAAIFLALTACGAAGARPGVTEARAYYYTDNSGVSVKTLAASVERTVAPRLSLSIRATTEQIVLERKPLDPGDPGAEQPTGHPPHEPDAVSSASSTAGGGAVATEWRFEGVAGVDVDRGGPVSGSARVRASTEPDYASIAGTLGGSIELARRNTTLGAFVGAGRDTVDPVEAPPGEADDWPASHARVNGGVTLSQLLTPRALVAFGVGVTHQWGRLANPYRRALVRTSLFPEAVPDERLRATAFASLSWYLGRDTALHARQGGYVDSWGVLAWIPELALVVEPRDRLLVTARYRFYKQWAADFYRARYQELESRLTGDARLGPITEHVAGADVRWGVGPCSIVLGYELSLLDYELLATDLIVGQVGSLGVSVSY